MRENLGAPPGQTLTEGHPDNAGRLVLKLRPASECCHRSAGKPPVWERSLITQPARCAGCRLEHPRCLQLLPDALGGEVLYGGNGKLHTFRSTTRSRTLETRPANGTHRGQVNVPNGEASFLLLIRISARFTTAKITSVNPAVRSARLASGTASASTRIAPTPIALPEEACASPGSAG